MIKIKMDKIIIILLNKKLEQYAVLVTVGKLAPAAPHSTWMIEIPEVQLWYFEGVSDRIVLLKLLVACPRQRHQELANAPKISAWSCMEY